MFSSTPLIDAAEDGDLLHVESLVGTGEDINQRGMLKMTALMAAASKGHTDVVIFLLKQPTIDVNTLNAGGTTALMTAARNGHLETVRALIASPLCDVNMLGRYGGTALMNAAGFGHIDIVKEFLKIDNISLAKTYSEKNHSPITIARQNGYPEIAALLVQFEQKREIKRRRRQISPKP